MEKEKVYQYEEIRRVRAIEEIAGSYLSKDKESFQVIDWKERERSRIMVLPIIKKGPAVKEAAPAKKVTLAKKAKGKVVELEEEAGEEEKLVKVLSAKEKAKLTKETKSAYAMLLTAPPPPFITIVLGLNLAKYNPNELCSLWNDISPRIAGVTGLAACIPTIAYLDGISEALEPLANKPGGKI